MKHIHTFSQHINENSIRPEVVEIESTEYGFPERSPLTDEEASKLKSLADLAQCESRERHRVFTISKKVSTREDSFEPPLATFMRSTEGIWYMRTVSPEETRRYYKAKSLDALIPVAIGTLNPRINWAKIG